VGYQPPAANSATAPSTTDAWSRGLSISYNLQDEDHPRRLALKLSNFEETGHHCRPYHLDPEASGLGAQLELRFCCCANAYFLVGKALNRSAATQAQGGFHLLTLSTVRVDHNEQIRHGLRRRPHRPMDEESLPS